MWSPGQEWRKAVNCLSICVYKGIVAEEATDPPFLLGFKVVQNLYWFQNTEVKKNIRQFSGFVFSKEDKEYEKRVTALNK